MESARSCSVVSNLAKASDYINAKLVLLRLFVGLFSVVQAGCGNSRRGMVEVTLRGDGSAFQKGDVHVVLNGDDVRLNGTEQIKTLGSVISFRYPDGRPDEIELLLLEE